jgi:hypothetical protein
MNKITRRGKIVITLFLVALIALFTYATRDVCWVGDGYGSCQKLVNQYGG